MHSPVRKVRSNGRTITGTFSSPKTGRQIQFESYLEYVFIEILEFDSQVIDILDQPLKIEFTHKKKNQIHYPDFKVIYKHRRPVIFEVKYQEEIDGDQDGIIARKLKAGKQYAKSHDCSYRIITDKDLLTVYSTNVDKLLQFRSETPDLCATNKLVNALKDLEISTPNQLLDAITSNQEERLKLLRQVWILVLKRRISIDILTAINQNSTIWLSTRNDFKEFNFPYKYAMFNKR